MNGPKFLAYGSPILLVELNICANLTCDECGIQEGSTEGSANNIASPQDKWTTYDWREQMEAVPQGVSCP